MTLPYWRLTRDGSPSWKSQPPPRNSKARAADLSRFGLPAERKMERRESPRERGPRLLGGMERSLEPIGLLLVRPTPFDRNWFFAGRGIGTVSSLTSFADIANRENFHENLWPSTHSLSRNLWYKRGG